MANSGTVDEVTRGIIEIHRVTLGASIDLPSEDDNESIKGTLFQLDQRAFLMNESIANMAEDGKAAGETVLPLSPIPQPHRPFRYLEAHADASELCIAIVGRNVVSVAVASCLVRCGASTLLLCESGTQGSPDTGVARNWNEVAEMLQKASPASSVTVVDVDPSKKENRAAFVQGMERANLFILDADADCDKAAVSEVCLAKGIPWVLTKIDQTTASFWYQYFLKDVDAVQVTDVVAAPIIQHMKDVKEPLAAAIEATFISSSSTFAAMLAHSIMKYWFGISDVHGYLWYNTVCNKFSSASLADLQGYIQQSATLDFEYAPDSARSMASNLSEII